MKVLIVDLDGANTGPVVQALLKKKFPGNEYKIVAASDKTAGKGLARKMVKAVKPLGIELEAVEAVPFAAEHSGWADKVILENKNNAALIHKRVGITFDAAKTVNLELPSGLHVKAADAPAYVEKVKEAVEKIAL